MNTAIFPLAAVALLALSCGSGPASGPAGPSAAGFPGRKVLAPAAKEAHMSDDKGLKTAILGGGCFWCLEAVYELVPGVVSVENGYSGGARENPSYEEVCSGLTGHAEVVRITFEPAKVSYAELLDLFWKIHDPTTPNRQGADVGEQYRSAIFCADEDQRREAEASRKRAQALFAAPIVTEIEIARRFWPAEDYHQDYFRRNPDQAYCRIVIAPKLKKAGF